MILHSNRSYMDNYYKTEQARHLNHPVNKKSLGFHIILELECSPSRFKEKTAILSNGLPVPVSNNRAGERLKSESKHENKTHPFNFHILLFTCPTILPS